MTRGIVRGCKFFKKVNVIVTALRMGYLGAGWGGGCQSQNGEADQKYAGVRHFQKLYVAHVQRVSKIR